jgi:hypothetical protein
MNGAVSTLINQARNARETGALERAFMRYQQAADLCALSQNLEDRAFVVVRLAEARAVATILTKVMQVSIQG